MKLENPQAMIGESFDMYQLMQSHHVENQHWIHLEEHGEEYGCLVIDNTNANFQNVSFLESLSAVLSSMRSNATVCSRRRFTPITMTF